jgi:hypothetical protein
MQRPLCTFFGPCSSPVLAFSFSAATSRLYRGGPCSRASRGTRKYSGRRRPLWGMSPSPPLRSFFSFRASVAWPAPEYTDVPRSFFPCRKSAGPLVLVDLTQNQEIAPAIVAARGSRCHGPLLRLHPTSFLPLTSAHSSIQSSWTCAVVLSSYWTLRAV